MPWGVGGRGYVKFGIENGVAGREFDAGEWRRFIPLMCANVR